MGNLQHKEDFNGRMLSVQIKDNSYNFLCLRIGKTSVRIPSLVGMFKRNSSGKMVLFDCRLTEDPSQYFQTCSRQMLFRCDAIGLHFIDNQYEAQEIADIKKDLLNRLHSIQGNYNIAATIP